MQLLQCPQHQPSHGGSCGTQGVGVRCEQKIVKGVSAANVTTSNCSTLHTVLINVTLVNNNVNSFQVGCYNQQHGVYLTNFVSNKTSSFTTLLRGLFPSSLYTCCISDTLRYCQQFIARGTYINIKTPELLSKTESSDLFTSSLSSTSNRYPVDERISESKTMTSVNLVGGILGFIVAVLLILFLLSVFVLVLQSGIKKYVIPKTRYADKAYCHPSVG